MLTSYPLCLQQLIAFDDVRGFRFERVAGVVEQVSQCCQWSNGTWGCQLTTATVWLAANFGLFVEMPRRGGVRANDVTTIKKFGKDIFFCWQFTVIFIYLTIPSFLLLFYWMHYWLRCIVVIRFRGTRHRRAVRGWPPHSFSSESSFQVWSRSIRIGSSSANSSQR